MSTEDFTIETLIQLKLQLVSTVKTHTPDVFGTEVPSLTTGNTTWQRGTRRVLTPVHP